MKISNKDIIIRLVSDVDLEENEKEFIDMIKENYNINFPEIDNLYELSLKNYDDMKKYNKNGSALIIGAFIGSRVIGFLWAYNRSFLGEQRLHISHVVVSPKYRSQGIGTKIIGFIKKLAIEKNILTIELLTTSENVNAIQFYKNHGFKVTRLQLEKSLGDEHEN